MARVKITHVPGVGDYTAGEIVEVNDRRANGLISRGYAVLVSRDERPESAMQQHQPGQRGRGGSGRERR